MLPIYVFRVFLFLTQLRPASSENCQHVLWSAIFSSRAWAYVTWSLGRRSNCVWAYSRWRGRSSWVEEGGGGVGGGWFCSVFAQWCLILFTKAQIEPVHNKLAKKKKTKTNDRHLLWAKHCWSTVGFNEQNSVTNKRDPRIVQKYVKCGVLYRPAFERLFASDRSGKSALQDQQGQNKGVI